MENEFNKSLIENYKYYNFNKILVNKYLYVSIYIYIHKNIIS